MYGEWEQYDSLSVESRKSSRGDRKFLKSDHNWIFANTRLPECSPSAQQQHTTAVKHAIHPVDVSFFFWLNDDHRKTYAASRRNNILWGLDRSRLDRSRLAIKRLLLLLILLLLRIRLLWSRWRKIRLLTICKLWCLKVLHWVPLLIGQCFDEHGHSLEDDLLVPAEDLRNNGSISDARTSSKGKKHSFSASPIALVGKSHLGEDDKRPLIQCYHSSIR